MINTGGQGRPIHITTIHLTVYNDATKVEVKSFAASEKTYWADNEASGLAMAAENLLIESAIFATSRKLPPIAIRCDYKESKSEKVPIKFVPGVKARIAGGHRKIVRTPGSAQKPWLNSV